MKMKRSDVLMLDGTFTSLLELKLEPEVAFKIASNSILATELAETVRKSYKPVEGHKEVQEARAKMLKNLGAVPGENGTYTIPASRSNDIAAKMDAFSEEHSDVIAEQAKYDEKFNIVLEEEVEIEFQKISMKELTVSIEPGKLVAMIKTGIIEDGNKS